MSADKVNDRSGRNEVSRYPLAAQPVTLGFGIAGAATNHFDFQRPEKVFMAVLG